MASGTVRLFCLTSLLPVVASVTLLPPMSARAQVSAQPAGTVPVPVPVPVQLPPLPAIPAAPSLPAPADPNNSPPLVLESTLLSLEGGQRLMDEAGKAVTAQDYDGAAKKLLEARQVFNQLSNFYQELGGSFSGIDSRISDSLRRKALDTAQMRDQATYQLALVHRAQNKPELAVPLLVQIIRSQQPTRELGKKAYQQLFELGFVDAPYPRPRADESGSTPPRKPDK